MTLAFTSTVRGVPQQISRSVSGFPGAAVERKQIRNNTVCLQCWRPSIGPHSWAFALFALHMYIGIEEAIMSSGVVVVRKLSFDFLLPFLSLFVSVWRLCCSSKICFCFLHWSCSVFFMHFIQYHCTHLLAFFPFTFILCLLFCFFFCLFARVSLSLFYILALTFSLLLLRICLKFFFCFLKIQ